MASMLTGGDEYAGRLISPAKNQRISWQELQKGRWVQTMKLGRFDGRVVIYIYMQFKVSTLCSFRLTRIFCFSLKYYRTRYLLLKLFSHKYSLLKSVIEKFLKKKKKKSVIEKIEKISS